MTFNEQRALAAELAKVFTAVDGKLVPSSAPAGLIYARAISPRVVDGLADELARDRYPDATHLRAAEALRLRGMSGADLGASDATLPDGFAELAASVHGRQGAA